MKQMKNPILFFSVALFSGFLLPGGENILFENGKSDYFIRIPEKAAPAEEFAAEELRTILKKSGNVLLPIRRGGTLDENAKAIVLESIPSARSDAPDEIRVRCEGGRLVLSGNRPRCVLYAVCLFAERELGLRWLWGGPDGEFYPKKSRFIFDRKLDIRFIPGFAGREMTPCGKYTAPESELWAVRNFMNAGVRNLSLREKTGTEGIEGGHRVRLPEEMFKTHPEYFSMIGGKRDVRGVAGCWSNPGFLDYIAKQLVLLIDERRIETLNVFPADIHLRCECNECTKEPDIPSRWFLFYEKIQDRIHKVRPGVKFSGIAYHEYQKAPECALNGLRYVEYCLYDRCYVHQFGNQACPYNRKALAALREWQTKHENIPLGVYCYEADIFKSGRRCYLPVMNMLADQMKTFRKMGVTRVKTEFIHDSVPVPERSADQLMKHRWFNYLFATLSHSPERDVREILQDYCKTLYGPAAGEMFEYHTGMAEAWDRMDIHLVWFFHDPVPVARHMLTPRLIEMFRGKFISGTARIDALPDSPEKKRWRKEIDLESALFEEWAGFYRASLTEMKNLLIPKRSGKDAFEKAVSARMVNRKGSGLKTECLVCWDDKALHLRIIAFDSAPDAIRKGNPGRDVSLWNDDNIELFLQPDGQSSYYHFAVNPAGGTYDAVIKDTTPNPAWKADTFIDGRGWGAELVIPFEALNYKGSPEGKSWRMIVNRNAKYDTAGFPRPLFHRMDAAANIIFHKAADKDKRLTVFLPEKDSGGNNFIPELAAYGWNTEKLAFPSPGKDGMTTDAVLKDARIILISHPGIAKAPPAFYTEKIVPALENGALVIFDDGGFTPFGTLFRDEKLNVARLRKEKLDPARVVIWKNTGAFSRDPNSLKGLFSASAVFAYDAFSKDWIPLAAQRLKDGSEKPFLMALPYKNGMIVACGGLNLLKGKTFPLLLENLVRFRQKYRGDLSGTLPGQ